MQPITKVDLNSCLYDWLTLLIYHEEKHMQPVTSPHLALFGLPEHTRSSDPYSLFNQSSSKIGFPNRLHSGFRKQLIGLPIEIDQKHIRKWSDLGRT
jgi:hypothetical protein